MTGVGEVGIGWRVDWFDNDTGSGAEIGLDPHQASGANPITDERKQRVTMKKLENRWDDRGNGPRLCIDL